MRKSSVKSRLTAKRAKAVAGEGVRAATVDRTERTDLLSYDVLPAWARTKWHRPRADDRAVAACSYAIILNPEDEIDAAAVASDQLCRRCFR